MRTTIIGLAMLAVAADVTAQDNDVLNIKGQLTGINDTLLVIKRAATGNGWDCDTLTVAQGRFDGTTTLRKPQMLYLLSPAAQRREQGAAASVQIIGVPGETVVIEGDPNVRYDISGSTFYSQYHEADIVMENAQKAITAINDEYRSRVKAGEDAKTVGEQLEPKMKEAQKAYKNSILNFIRQHPDYEASAALLPYLEEIALMQPAVDALAENVREGRMKEFYQPVLKQARTIKEMEEKAAKVQATGADAPDFTLTDINGKPLALSSLRGKCVVIDFWGLWCIWCIKGMPKMKEYYEKYKGKFEILGVDCNDTEEKWKAAVAKHELPWLHVYNPRGNKDDVCSKYAIQGFPTKVIVGADGKIVKTIVGEDPEFYTILDELLK